MDLEKTMQFIVEQQAAFSSDILELKQRDETLAAQLSEITGHIKMLATTAEHMLTTQQEHEQWLSKLSNSHERMNSWFDRLTEAQLRTEEAQLRTEEAQRRNEEAINILIRTVQDILPRLPKQ